MRNFFCVLLVTLVFYVSSCSKEGESPLEQVKETKVKSDANALLSLKVTIDDEVYTALVTNNQVVLELPDDTDRTVLSPIIEISESATMLPKSGSAQNFNEMVTYTVTAENGEKMVYEVRIMSKKSGAVIKTFSFKNLAKGQSNYTLKNSIATDIDTIIYKVPYLSPVKALLSDIYVSDGATIVPKSGETLDYSSPVKYKVTSENGTDKEYLVMVDNSLKKLEISKIVSSQFIDQPLGGNITFEVNELNPILDSIQVKLVGDLEYKLNVVAIDETNKTITAKLPDSYVNNHYTLQVNIAYDNADESDGFLLNKGDINFKYVSGYSVQGQNLPYTTLLVPKETFYISAYLDRSEIESYLFSLRKNNQSFPLKVETIDPNFQTYKLSMPSLMDASSMEEGTGYKLVISKNGIEQAFDFVNSNQQEIEVLVAKDPVISSTNVTTFNKNDVLTLMGNHLYYPYVYSSEAIAKSKLTFKYQGGGFESSSNEVDVDGNLLFNIENIPSGNYDVTFKNNISATDVVTYGSVTVALEASEHSTLSVDTATLYASNATLAKQILISFSGNIDNVVVEKIVIKKYFSDLVIANYTTNTSTVLTGQISAADYTELYNRRHDGYVLIKDNNTAYKLPFKLSFN